MSLWVYILKCSDSTYYTGITNNLDRRFTEHQEGFNTDAYTFKRRPVELQYAEEFTDYKLGYAWEKKLKGWSAKKKKALIEEDWDELRKFATCQNETHGKNKNIK